MSIKPLPPEVVSQIKSSTAITSLNSAVCGLVENSLDAHAFRITVSVDYSRGNCSVEDDGLGISPSEFASHGGLGKLHFTSKYPASKDIHGRNGAFIASVASLSLLSVISHHHGYNSHNSIQIRNSEVLARQMPSPPEQRLLAFPHGTRVTVRDLFGLMPVRVKQRAAAAERGTHARDWEVLKHSIVATLLSWSVPVSVSVRESSNQWAFSIKNSDSAQRGTKTPGSDLSSRITKLLYQTQLFDKNDPEIWIPLRASAGSFSVIGTVSLCPMPNKRLQFISIGIRPLINEHGSNVLYEEINRLFSNSSFGTVEAYRPEDEEQQIQAKDRSRTESFTGQELKGRKGVDRWPMFYIKIILGDNAIPSGSRKIDEILDERHGSLQAIIDLIKIVFYEFLKKHHFRPKRPKRKRDGGSYEPSRQVSLSRQSSARSSSRSSAIESTTRELLTGDLSATKFNINSTRGTHSRPASPFDTWSKIKSGKSQYASAEGKLWKESNTARSESPAGLASKTSKVNPSTSDNIEPLFGSGGELLRPPFAGVDVACDQGHLPWIGSRSPTVNTDESIKWTHPTTKEVLTIDARPSLVTGSSWTTNDNPSSVHKVHAVQQERIRTQTQPNPSESRSAWLDNLLSSWENPVFGITEPRIPVVSNEGNDLDPSFQVLGESLSFNDESKVRQTVQSRVSKAALQDAQVIAQVDRKFILARVASLVEGGTRADTSSNRNNTVVLVIDQHAADERIRVEELMKDYFSFGNKGGDERSEVHVPIPCTELLEKPIVFDVSTGDCKKFAGTLGHFEAWGIHYTIAPVPPKTNGGLRRVTVTKLPPSIAERCRLEPRLLIELMRKEAWGFEAGTSGPLLKERTITNDGDLTSPHWLSLLHGCPQGILDMINSRACRSSIMFNDALTLDECTRLLQRLAKCAFPFQCAHGRPSMIPIVDLGSTDIPVPGEERTYVSFGKAFKRWSAHPTSG